KRQHRGAHCYQPHAAAVLAATGLLGRVPLRKRCRHRHHRGRADGRRCFNIPSTGFANRYRELKSGGRYNEQMFRRKDRAVKRKQWVGLSMPRAESVEKVTGRALYAVDVSFPGMLWGKVLRSPIPHGRIKRINIDKALRLPGVRATVTGLDVATIKIGRQIYDMPVLADGVVRFTGEKVAAIAADLEGIAEHALERIDIEYEELSPVLDPMESLARSAILLHPQRHGIQRIAWETFSAEQCFRSTIVEKRRCRRWLSPRRLDHREYVSNPGGTPGLYRAALLRRKRK